MRLVMRVRNRSQTKVCRRGRTQRRLQSPTRLQMKAMRKDMPAVIASREQLMESMSSATSETRAVTQGTALGRHAEIDTEIDTAIGTDIAEKRTIRMRRPTPRPLMVMRTIGV